MPNEPTPRIAYAIKSLEGGGAAGPMPGIVEVIASIGATFKVMLSAPDPLHEIGHAGRAGLIELDSKERFRDTGCAVVERLRRIRV